MYAALHEGMLIVVFK